MKLVIHRGTHEIGGSCVEVRSDRSDARIVIDLGMPLVQANRSPFDWHSYEHLPAEELLRQGVLPSVSGLYSHEQPGVAAVLVSHAHQDHYGFLRFVHPNIPIYCSAGTRALIEVSNVFLSTAVNLGQVREFAMWKPFCFDGFRVTPYLMDHSAPDAAAFAVESDGQKLFYTGDFRGHGRKRVLLDRLLKNPVRDVDCLLMEGTLLGRGEGPYPDETAVEEAVRNVITKTDSYTFVFCSGQNLDRIVSVYRAALRTDAMFVIDLYTAFVLDRLSVISSSIPQFNWRNVRVLYSRWHAEKLAAHDRRLLYRYRSAKVGLADLKAHPGRVVFLCKDNRYFRQMLGHLGSLGDARAVYSMWSGYLERSNLGDTLASHGIDMVKIHTSGHAVQEDLKRLTGALNPQCVVPIHTFQPELFREMFPNAVILNDGEVFPLPGKTSGTREAIMHKPVIRRYFTRDSTLTRVAHDFRYLIPIVNGSHGEFSIQLRENCFSIYCKGSSLARVSPSTAGKYSVEINRRYLEGPASKWLRKYSFGEPFIGSGGRAPNVRFYVEPKWLRHFFRRKHLDALAANIAKVSYSEEVAFEQVLMTDNPPSDTFIIIDRQVADHAFKKQMDLLALARRTTAGSFHFLVIEVKLGNNAELREAVGRQIREYVAHVRMHIDDYVACYRENYRQKKLMRLLGDNRPDEIEIAERVEGLVVTGGYSQQADRSAEILEGHGLGVRVQVTKNTISPY